MLRHGNGVHGEGNGGSDGGSNGQFERTLSNDHDAIWEAKFAMIEDDSINKAMFGNGLPWKAEDVEKVYKKFNDSNHIGPIVLGRKIPQPKFLEWLKKELGLHKAIRLPTGTVYCPQACSWGDHGLLRGILHKERNFPILALLDASNEPRLETASGEVGGQNPDVMWFRSAESYANARVVFEIGIMQSLTNLRSRAYSLFTNAAWLNLHYVVLIKQYPAGRIYVEVWERDAVVAAGVAAPPNFSNNQAAPNTIAMNGTMRFVCNAHATNPAVLPPAAVPTSVQWQVGLPTQCTLPGGNEILPDGPNVTLDASFLLSKCRFV